MIWQSAIGAIIANTRVISTGMFGRGASPQYLQYDTLSRYTHFLQYHPRDVFSGHSLQPLHIPMHVERSQYTTVSERPNEVNPQFLQWVRVEVLMFMIYKSIFNNIVGEIYQKIERCLGNIHVRAQSNGQYWFKGIV